jgi:DNA-binding transcriptional LysR family regulator
LAAGADFAQLSSVELSSSPLHILFERTSDLATRREFVLGDLGKMPWILFAPQVHPSLYEAIAERALNLGANPSERQHVTSAEQAALLVKSTGGVAFLTKSEAWRVAVDGLTFRPLTEPGLTVKTVVVARNDAGRLVSEFMRAIVKKVRRIASPAQQKFPAIQSGGTVSYTRQPVILEPKEFTEWLEDSEGPPVHLLRIFTR